MKLKRVNGGKGQRWKKGHSCISNAGNTTHRQAAKGNFFQKLDGESGLTIEALAKHTATLGIGAKLSADSEDDQSVGKTLNTFATNFTTCTIPAFEKFFKSFSIESELQARMLAIHAAAQEYIQDANLNESSTTYMCALMVSLEGVKDSEDDITATLSLLAKVIRKVNKDILRVKFGEYSSLLDRVFTSFSNSNNPKLLTNIIGCLSVLLRAQEKLQWTYSSTRNLFQKIISFSTHENADIRRAAQYNASAILKGSSFMVSDESSSTSERVAVEIEIETEGLQACSLPISQAHPAADACGKFITTNLKLATENIDGKTTLYLLIFLEQVITCLPRKSLEECCGRVLGVMHISNSVVNNRALKLFGSLFMSEASISALTAETNEALINALTSSGDASHSLLLVPSMNDCNLSTLWMDVIAAGLIHLTRFDASVGIDRFSLWMEQLSSFWKSESEVVHEKVWHIIDYFFDECVKPLKECIPTYVESLLAAFHQVEKCLSLQFESAWPYVFSALSPFFVVLGAHISSEMMPCLKNLVSFMNTPDLKGKKQLESAIGAAINGMGPEEVVLKMTPLQITGDIREDEVNLWILPIIKKFLKNKQLCFFITHFMPLTQKCRVILDRLKEQGKQNSLLGKTYEVIERQIWALFPSFADGAVDIEEALTKDFVIVISHHIKCREDTRIDVMTALRNMLSVSSRTSNLAMYHGKELLPALFGICLMKPRDKFPEGAGHHLIDPGQRLAAFATIEAFFLILRSDKFPIFFKKLLEKLDSETCDAFTHRALLSLAKCFLPYLNTAAMDIVYKKAEADLASRDSNLQKAAYRIIEMMLSTDSSECRLFIENHIDCLFALLLLSSSVIPSAKAARLRCLLKLLDHLSADAARDKTEQFLREVVQESIKCCGHQNSTPTRKAAFALLSAVGKSVQKNLVFTSEDTFQQCLTLLPPLMPPSELSANIILALMALFYQYKVPASTLKSTVDAVSSLLECQERNIIKAALGFLRMVFAFFPSCDTSDHVDIAVRRIVQMPEEGRKKFRTKIRDIFGSLIRKFGADTIKNLVPQEDYIFKMVSNLVKKEKRRKRMRRESEDQEGKEQSIEAVTSLDEILAEIDHEIDEDDRPMQAKKTCLKGKKPLVKKGMWIRENEDKIVDLLDISSAQHITNKKPKTKLLRFEAGPPQTEEEKYGFKFDRKAKKYIITEKDFDAFERENDSADDDGTAVDVPEIFVCSDDKSKLQHASKRKRKTSEGSEDSGQPSPKFATSIKGEQRVRVKKKFNYGAEFRSKNAGGDVAKKGGVMPYAYVQFSKEKLNKRKKAKYAGQFRSLVRGAKRGAAKGTRMKSKKNNS